MNRTELMALIPDSKRLIFDSIGKEYLQDKLGRLKGEAQVLAFPVSTQEVSALMRYAHVHQIPVTPRGAGTNLVGSTVPLQGGIIIDLSRMNRILEIDPTTLHATVEPGVLLQDLQARVEKEGLFYPPDPGEKASTIGGNISTNAGGMRAVKYGVTRDYVRGLEIVTADGKVVQLGGKNVKDASGLSLKNLIIGSEGTLAIITKCILKLVPKPETSVSVLVPYPDLKTGIDSVPIVLQANADPTAVEFMENKVVRLGETYAQVKFPCPEAGSYLLLTFDGSKEAVKSRVEKVQQLVLEQGALQYIILNDPQQAADIWRVRGALVKAVEAVSEQEPVDIVVPINQITKFIYFIQDLEKQTNMQMVRFGHAGDGNVHLCIVRENREEAVWRRELAENMEKVYHKAYELGGLVSGEHGIGVNKRPYFFHGTSPENVTIMNQIKNAMDPLHILNDQKSYIMEGTYHANTI